MSVQYREKFPDWALMHTLAEMVDRSRGASLSTGYTAITPLKYFSQELLEICFFSDSHARRLCGVI